MKYTVSSIDVKFLDFFARSLLQSQCFYQMIVGIASQESFTILLRGAADEVKVYQQAIPYRDNPVSKVIAAVRDDGKMAVESAMQEDKPFELLCFPLPQFHEKAFVLFDSKGFSDCFSDDTRDYLHAKTQSVANLRSQLTGIFESHQSQISRLRKEAATLYFNSQENESSSSVSSERLEEAETLLETVKQSRKKLYTLFDNISVGLCSVDPSRHIVNANSYFSDRIAHKPIRDLVGQGIDPYIGIKEDMTAISEVFESGEVRSLVLDDIPSAGKEKVFSVELFPIYESESIIEVGLLFKDITELMKTQKTFRDFQKFTQKKFRNFDALQKEYNLLSEKYKGLYNRYVTTTRELQEMSKKYKLLGAKYDQSVALLEKGSQGSLMKERVEEQKKRRELVLLLSRQKDMVENLLFERTDVARSFGEGYQRYLHQVSVFINQVENMAGKSNLNSPQVESLLEKTSSLREQLERYTQLIAPVFEVISDLRRRIEAFSRDLDQLVENTNQSAPTAKTPSEHEPISRPLGPTQAAPGEGSPDGIQLFVLS
ncbi:hypothetical protein [Desulfurispira natronophila]|uniref:PAS domain-containing protein n=1 Tax=Desulfurispira natronophila TaxID=682562 RepID=A0A7W7Y2X8_9BACT|nr:hypothetical protein [Desulfurispira natronophila]MBB5021082.1 PAS domain-containing protein [Desulfurispira natronophila]